MRYGVGGTNREEMWVVLCSIHTHNKQLFIYAGQWSKNVGEGVYIHTYLYGYSNLGNGRGVSELPTIVVSVCVRD
jgi:hypothetical protein